MYLFRRASASKTIDKLKVEPGSQKESADHTGTNKGMTLKTGTGTGTGTSTFLEIKTHFELSSSKFLELFGKNLNQVIPIKNGALNVGFQYTDTSHEIQALQDAMRQIGTGTMDTKDFTFQDSSVSVFAATGQTANTDDVTGGFDMKPVAPPRTGILV